MEFKIQATDDGIIKIKSSTIINIKRPNSISAAKSLGNPLVLNVKAIVFLGHDNDGNVTYFLTNNIEISLNLFYKEAADIFCSALSGQNLTI